MNTIDSINASTAALIEDNYIDAREPWPRQTERCALAPTFVEDQTLVGRQTTPGSTRRARGRAIGQGFLILSATVGAGLVGSD